jgi:hypothetical protein
MDERDFAKRWELRFRDAAEAAAKRKGEKDGKREVQGLLDEGSHKGYVEDADKGHVRPRSLLTRAMEGDNVAGVPIPASDRLGNVDGAETLEFQADYERRRAAVRERLKRLHQNRSDAR